MIKEKFKRDNYMWKVVACLVLCFVVMGMLQMSTAKEESEKAVITLAPESVEIVQEEEVPEITAKAIGSGDLQLVLDADTGYTVQNLLDSFNKGNHYQISCNVDGKIDGDFPIKIKLSEKIEDSLSKDWLGKVRIDLKDGKVTVKNKYGQWEGEKFKKSNGQYAVNEFVNSKGKTYYMGPNGKKQTGWKEKDGQIYYFDKKGIMQTGWKEKDGIQIYLKEDGSMAVGWQKIKDDKYYFDQNGKVVTGKQQIGTKKCEFAKDGKLISEENSIDPNKPMLALTFDDGPGVDTEKILDVLKANGARATFFMLAPKVEKYPNAVKKMKDIGCELANHSTTHTDLTKLTPEEIRKELSTTVHAVAKVTGGFPTTLVRPPYGKKNATVKATVGQPIIMWSIDTLDWKTRNAQSTINNVLKNAKDGDIVLMHDIHKQSVEAAVQLIPMLVQRGYQLVTVSELAEARGVTMESGASYSQFRK
ncbi:polysaccharide deacetylase family protein [Faecalimonas sp.]